ncbi:MAG TPA: hypothetical protein VGY56_07525 [Verrucomicrobiae bacterium]|nr:hypothetical protein [Verrucomicrobiae bacterium]
MKQNNFLPDRKPAGSPQPVAPAGIGQYKIKFTPSPDEVAKKPTQNTLKGVRCPGTTSKTGCKPKRN